jgi:MATE family multidrug resistance protein
VLIFGKFGFPMLGIAGAGWGMTIADWIITTIVCILLWFSHTYKPYIRSIFTLSKPSYIGQMLHIGIPMGAMFCAETGYFFLMTISMGWISVAALAANQITMQYLGFLISVVFSISQAITVRMGHLLGANEVDAAERAAYAGIIFCLIFMIITAQLYWFFPELLISIDLDIHNSLNSETVSLAASFLSVCAFFQIFESVRLSLFGALRGLKDTRFTLITSIISFWCIALPVGYLFSIKLGFGGQAFWWAMVAGAFVSVILLFKRFNVMINRFQTPFHASIQ